MTVKERMDLADCLHGKGYNCAQAVACAFVDKVDMDEKVLFSITEGFGLGMGAMEGTCGALSGAVAISGMLNSSGDVSRPTKGSTYKLGRQMDMMFREMNSSAICKELKGVETGKVLRSCDGCIRDAVKIASKVLFNER